VSIILDAGSRVLVQGITGSLGRAETEKMLDNGTNVVAGVTPGKGGSSVRDIPVYDTVAEAVRAHAPTLAMSYVPARLCADAGRDVIDAGVPILGISAEHMPIHDVARLLAWARKSGTEILGPNSLGVASPGKGYLGGMGARDASRIFKPGSVGVVSKSGGMGVEICWALTQAGLGQSSFVALGGDRISGMSFGRVAELFQDDPETAVILLFGEVGAPYEREMAERLSTGRVTKPVVAIISGEAVERFPGTKFGHGGAIVDQDSSKATHKRAELAKAGAHLVSSISDAVDLVADLLDSRRLVTGVADRSGAAPT
jgi:succinyl-CoA synthetase alpha subunit